MTDWTEAELDAIGGTDELDIANRRRDGTLRTARIVWVVRHDDALYVRSVNGHDAAWYRGVQTRHKGHIAAGGIEKDVTLVDADHGLDDALDAEYRSKYGRYPGPTERITAAAAAGHDPASRPGLTRPTSKVVRSNTGHPPLTPGSL